MCSTVAAVNKLQKHIHTSKSNIVSVNQCVNAAEYLSRVRPGCFPATTHGSKYNCLDPVSDDVFWGQTLQVLTHLQTSDINIAKVIGTCRARGRRCSQIRGCFAFYTCTSYLDQRRHTAHLHNSFVSVVRVQQVLLFKYYWHNLNLHWT